MKKTKAIRLSKKICELCGIKPKVVYDYENNEILIYPDFYCTENFVKLMEIKPFNSKSESDKVVKDLTIFDVVYSYDANSNRLEFLKNFVQLISWDYSYITISRSPDEHIRVNKGTERMRNAIKRARGWFSNTIE